MIVEADIRQVSDRVKSEHFSQTGKITDLDYFHINQLKLTSIMQQGICILQLYESTPLFTDLQYMVYQIYQ